MELFYCSSPQEQTDYLIQAEAMVKYLLARGWSISKHRQADRNVPCKPRKTCVWTPKRRVKSKSTGVRPPTAIREEEVAFLSYEPEVMDLEKVEVSIKLLVREGGRGGREGRGGRGGEGGREGGREGRGGRGGEGGEAATLGHLHAFLL